MLLPRLVIFTLTLTLALPACQQVKSGDVLFEDNFADPGSGWMRRADGEAVTDYADGEYQIEINAFNLNVWVASGPKLADSVVNVEARVAGGPDNNLYGVLCRYRDDKNFYFFFISADGYYAIGKFRDGKQTFLSGASYQYSDKILPGQVANQLTATCAGNTLSLSVNGTQLAQAADQDFADGQTGLIAGTFELEESPVDIRYDNLLVTQP
jgi:DNA-binding beta-propeller fold protein YncE